MTFEDYLNSLIYYYLEEHSSAKDLLPILTENDFPQDTIAPQEGMEKSSFSESINIISLQQLLEVFEALIDGA
jgi:hypothetical protein